MPFGLDYEKYCFLKRFTVLDEAVAFAKVQVLHWRNVYDGASAPQKIAYYVSDNKRQNGLFYFNRQILIDEVDKTYQQFGKEKS